MDILFTHIRQLIQVREDPTGPLRGSQMNELPCIEEAYLLVRHGRIAGFGPMSDCPDLSGVKRKNLQGRLVLPGWCDSHTHLVYAGNRSGEFVDRINGLSYKEIAEKGGGILNSARLLQATGEEELYQQAAARLEEVIALGTTGIEIKSGYGLNPDAELKMLKVVRRLKENYPVDIRATFLAAHALPPQYKENKQAFMDLMLGETLEEISEQGLADYIDVFCESGYFDLEDTRQVLEAGRDKGLAAKIHVNQFNAFGGVGLAVEHRALTVDHLEELRAEDVEALKGSRTLAVALPGCSHFLSIPYTPAKELMDAGVAVVLATDFNPGSAPSGNMNFVVSLACVKMKLTPEQAINAATLNGAYAMGIETEQGSITVGKKAHLMVTQPLESYAEIPYRFAHNLIDEVYLNGEVWKTEMRNQ
jgi:imidazolonepropionase